jgi:hypothetical protein
MFYIIFKASWPLIKLLPITIIYRRSQKKEEITKENKKKKEKKKRTR